MKIFVSGKGGSGKSTVSALLGMEFAKRGREVLVVDNDESNYGIHTHLGLDLPKDFMYYFGGKKDLFDRTEDIKDGMETENLPDEYLSKEGNLGLLAIGKIKEYGEGCACPMNVLSGEFLKSLSLDDEEILIVDMDAGIEHFGRKVEDGADIVLLVIDPTRESIKLSEKITEFTHNIDKSIYFILNKVDEETEKVLYESVDENKVIGVIPENERIFKASLNGEPLDFQLASVEEIVDSLIEIEGKVS